MQRNKQNTDTLRGSKTKCHRKLTLISGTENARGADVKSRGAGGKQMRNGNGTETERKRNGNGTREPAPNQTPHKSAAYTWYTRA